MTLPVDDQSDTSALGIAREMANRGVSRHQFVAAINASGEEMVRSARHRGAALMSVYRVVREYRAEALEEFDRLTAGSARG
ncbi:hypothetical protein EAH89_26200 [Roseomonas nepalensis]|uniref:Uncharacterized protein n=1 Tax=Muricoccus nepalensis TaxID=1854500 RepID=A0A502F8I2_9PROT|nr:hypothetical protein [Roseomonas nepalensis]TPG45695.1 hypothetical protein EAH89_26200 [Roseomonas nepalensis]